MYRQDLRMMILTASFGEGHLQASRALKQNFFEQGINKVDIIDLMQEAHPFLNTVSKKLYITSTKTPQYGIDYYGWSYYKTQNNRQNNAWNKYFNYLGSKKLKEMIYHIKPDAIINVFPFGAAPEIAYGLTIPTFTVLTDYALHSRWIHPNTDKYYVATDELKTELLAKGFDREQVVVTGIPIRSIFYQVSHENNPFNKLLSSSRKTVLITAGAHGVLNKVREMAHILLSRTHCQLVIVCGRNKKLENHLKAIFNSDKDIHVFGYVNNMHELMAASSCMITKAGGLTLSEALALLLPIFIFKPLGGQERENALYFAEKDIAKISHNTEELENQIISFLSDESCEQEMKMHMVNLRQEESASRIVEDILRTIREKALQTV